MPPISGPIPDANRLDRERREPLRTAANAKGAKLYGFASFVCFAPFVVQAPFVIQIAEVLT